MRGFEIFPWGETRSKTGDYRKTLSDMKECGFTGSGFVNAGQVELCREIGLYPTVFIYCKRDVKSNNDAFRSPEDGLLNVSEIIDDRSVPLDELEAAIREGLEPVPEGKARIYLIDEPGAGSFDRIRFAAECVRRIRPELSVYVNLLPNYAVAGARDLSQLETETYAEYLEQFCQRVPGVPLSYDNYEVILSCDGENPRKMRNFFVNFVQARACCDKYGVDFYHVIDSNQLRPDRTVPTMANLLLQANTSLAAGARSVSWFTYFGRGDYSWAPVDDNGDREIRTPVWYLVKEVNRRILSMGRELEKMSFDGMFFSDPGDIEGAKGIDSCGSVSAFFSSLPCMIGAYSDESRRTYVVVNTSLERSATVELKDTNGADAEIWSYEEHSYIAPLLHSRQGVSPLWIGPGDAVMLSVKI